MSSLITRAKTADQTIVELVGNIAKKPELLASGMCFLRLAVNGETKKDTVFYSIKYWGDDAAAIVAELQLGDAITVSVTVRENTFGETKTVGRGKSKRTFEPEAHEYIGGAITLRFVAKSAA